jgi:hypothetical protein
MKNYSYTALLALALFAGSPSAEDIQWPTGPEAEYKAHAVNVIVKMVFLCVKTVHENRPNDPFFQEFDAYYDPIKDRTFSNATRVGDQAPLFMFHKCIANAFVPPLPVEDATSAPAKAPAKGKIRL